MATLNYAVRIDFDTELTDKNYTLSCSSDNYTPTKYTSYAYFSAPDGISADYYASFSITFPANYSIAVDKDSTGKFITNNKYTITGNTITFSPTSSADWNIRTISSASLTYYRATVSIKLETQSVKYTLTQNLDNCTSNLTDRTDLELDEVISPIITANDGYYFPSNASYTNGDTTSYLSPYNNRTVEKGDITVAGDVVINATAVEMPVYNITQTLENCTSDYTAETVSGLQEYTITITANQYYTFNNAITYTYTMGESSGNLTISEDGASASVTLTPTNDITINAIAVKATYALTENLTGCTTNISEDTKLNAGETYNFILTANTDYIFDTAPTIKYDNSTYNFTVSSDKLTATYTYIATANAVINADALYTKVTIAANNDDNCTNNFVNGEYTIGSTVTMIYSFNEGWFYGSAVFKKSAGETTEITSTITPDENNKNVTIEFVVPDYPVIVNMTSYAGIKIVYSQLKNCTTEFPAGYYQQGKEYTIKLNANEGYKFMQEYVPTITVSTRASEVATLDFGFTDSSATFNFIADKGLLAIDLYSKVSTLTIDASAVGESTIEENYTFMHAYAPTNDELYELSGVRFSSYSTTTTGDYSTTTTVTNYDYGQFILKLYKTYIPVSSTLTDTIRLAYYDTKVDAPLIDDAIQRLNCGTVKITEINENNIDYEDTTAYIYLPFIGIFELPILSVMNHEITLKYNCNILDGSCYVTVSNETGVFATYTGEIKEEIPYTISYNEKVVQDYIASAMLTCDRTPYLYITSHKPLEDIGIFGTDNASKTDYIKNFSGYNVFANVDLITSANMLYDEVLAIRNLLQQGVFIND